MKKIQFFAIAAAMIAITSMYADGSKSFEQMDLDQMIRSVREKVEMRRREREEQYAKEKAHQEDSAQVEGKSEEASGLTPSKPGVHSTTGMVPGKRKHYSPFVSAKTTQAQPAKRKEAPPQEERLKVSFPKGYHPSPAGANPNRRKNRALTLSNQRGVKGRNASFEVFKPKKTLTRSFIQPRTKKRTA